MMRHMYANIVVRFIQILIHCVLNSGSLQSINQFINDEGRDKYVFNFCVKSLFVKTTDGPSIF